MAGKCPYCGATATTLIWDVVMAVPRDSADHARANPDDDMAGAQVNTISCLACNKILGCELDRNADE